MDIGVNEIHLTRELAAQHGLGRKIVGVPVGVLAGEIVLGVVGCRIEAARVRTPQPALFATKIWQ